MGFINCRRGIDFRCLSHSAPMRVSRILIVVCFAIECAMASTAVAQDPAVSVAFKTTTVSSGTTPASATTTTITAPGTGWSYSAAAQVPGSTFNQILKPNPQIPGGSGNGG